VKFGDDFRPRVDFKVLGLQNGTTHLITNLTLEAAMNVLCHIHVWCNSVNSTLRNLGTMCPQKRPKKMVLNHLQLSRSLSDSAEIFIKFDLRQLICASIIAFFDADRLCHSVTLTFGPLTLKVRRTSSTTWSKSVRDLSEIEQSPAELLIILRIFAHVMSRCE